jgi:hypothetical protein
MPRALFDFMHAVNTVRPERGPHHDRLRDFIGRWAVEGVNAPAKPGGPPDPVHGDERYTWHDGEYFLVNHFNRPAASGPFNGWGWIGYDANTQRYLSFSINNLGFLRIYEVEIAECRLTFHGEHERGRVSLNERRDRLAIDWEKSDDGRQWTMLCDLEGRRHPASTNST